MDNINARTMLLNQIQLDLAGAVKSRDQLRVDTLRFLLGAVWNLQIEKGKDYVATDNDVLSVVARQIKTHKESIAMFKQGKRPDLVEREERELAILQKLMPAQMSEEEMRKALLIISESNPGADFGALMKIAMAELKGKADGAAVASTLKQVLGLDSN